MKKGFLLALLITVVFGFGLVNQAFALTTGDLVATFGTVVTPLPVTPPVSIPVINASSVLLTNGSVDFAVLYQTGVYSYFYQVTNSGGGLDYALSRFSIDNPDLYPLLGSGVIADGLDPVVLTTGITNIGANLDPSGDLLTKTETTNRFYFQFSGQPGPVSGGLIDGGSVGARPVVGPRVPEPASMMLLGMGILGLFGLKRKVKA